MPQRQYGSGNRGARSGGRSGGFAPRRDRQPHHYQRPLMQRRGNRKKDAVIPHSLLINKVSVTEEADVFTPEHSFSDFPLESRLARNITKKGYDTPTPIQDNAVMHILHGKDVVGIANTGTGKTGAFLIPLIDKVLRDRSQCVLIMVPTRELAIQIEQEFKGFTQGLGLWSVCAVGGVNINPQIRTLKHRTEFVIGTPGRLKDLMARGALDLSHFQSVVLDEADRMLDMGFIADMRFILSHLPSPRHTLFFSATLSSEIEKLIGDFLNEPVRISVKTRDTSKDVDQDIVKLAPGEDKIERLASILRAPECKKVIIFGRTKHGVEKLGVKLRQMGFKADSIHGNKSHSQRQRALKDFKDERIAILVATDVAARGLDIPKVSHVINFEMPGSYDDYVHRIGRTGRAGERGVALTFV